MQSRKILIFSFLILAFNLSNAQKAMPFYEQLAFNFYRDSILPKYPIAKKISLTKDLINSNWLYDKGNCFKETLSVSMDSIPEIASEKYYSGKNIDSVGLLIISKSDKKQFKFSHPEKQSKPMLRFTFPRIYKNSVFVNICENRERNIFVYYIKMDINGNIQDWCRNEHYFYTSH